MAAEGRAVEKWNDTYCVGQLVEYWSFVREGEGVRAVTITKAYLLSGHTAVVCVSGKSGCIALTHVKAIK